MEEKGSAERETKIILLPDTPNDKDDIGIHGKIKNIIKEIIENNSDDKTSKKIIGLFGSWGSGKSTIIKLLEEDFKKNKRGKVFIFNTWMHKEEYLYRAFLYELYKDLGIEKIEEENDGKILLKDKIRKKIVKRVVTYNKNGENKNGKEKQLGIIKTLEEILYGVFLILFLFSIIGISILSPVFQNISENSVSTKIWGTSFVIIILFVLGFVFVIYKNNKDKIGGKFIKSIFNVDHSIEDTHETEQTEDFPSYEYKDILTEIIKKYIQSEDDNSKKINNKKLIIVLDDLDRVSDEYIEKMITLLMITDEAMKEIKEKININVWFIVPIDKKRLETMFEKLAEKENEIYKKQFKEEFIEKIFPYRLEVPDIIQTPWRKFFAEKYNIALKQYDENKMSILRYLFYLFVGDTKYLTPREIIQFINDISITYGYLEKGDREGEDTVGVVERGLYVGIKRYLSIDEIIKNIKENNNIRILEKNRDKQIINNVLDYLKKEGYSEQKLLSNILKLYYKTINVYSLIYGNKLISILKNSMDIEEAKEIWERVIEEQRLFFIKNVEKEIEKIEELIKLYYLLYNLKENGFIIEENIFNYIESIVEKRLKDETTIKLDIYVGEGTGFMIKRLRSIESQKKLVDLIIYSFRKGVRDEIEKRED